MYRKQFVFLIALILLLAVSILLMGIALLVSEKTFGIISSYIAIACVLVSLIGMVVIIRFNHKQQ